MWDLKEALTRLGVGVGHSRLICKGIVEGPKMVHQSH